MGLPERGLGVESDSREGFGSRETRVGALFTFDLGNRCTDRVMWRNVGVGLRGTVCSEMGWEVCAGGYGILGLGFLLPFANRSDYISFRLVCCHISIRIIVDI